uniref:Peroxisomal biogenesis factor 3 n=1 Tax=Romanomermis culicivorax TaxID=13658 RepID=A0A915IM05_ROMCU
MFTGVITGGIYAGIKCYDYFVTKDSRNNEFLFTTTIADDEETVQDNRDLNYDDFMKNDGLLANDETDGPIRETLAQVMPKNGKYDERTMKMFIFKSNQKTCENTIIQLVPSLKGGIHQRNDIESLLEDLQNGVEPNKLASWEKIKTYAYRFLRHSRLNELEKRRFQPARKQLFLINSSEALRAVTLIRNLDNQPMEKEDFLRIQISIVAADIYVKNANLRNKNGHQNNMVEKIFGDNIPSFFVNYFGNAQVEALDNTRDVSTNGASAATQQIFLQALQYFLTQGSISLMEKISCIVTDVVKILPLKENFTLSDFQQLLFEIQAKINRLNFSNFIVPLSVDGRDDDLHLFRDHNLGRMLNLLKICLENNKFKEILSQFIEEYVQSVVGFIRVNRREWKDNSEERLQKNEEEFIQKNEANLPLAKILPVLSDCFTFVSKLDTKSTFDRLLKAPCVLRYCMHIFDDYKI